MMELKGLPDNYLLETSKRKNLFFEDDNTPIIKPNTRGKMRIPGAKSIISVLDCSDPSFVEFVEQCLEYDPEKRITPEEALRNEWILEGLPPKVLLHHQRLHGIKTTELPKKFQSIIKKEEQKLAAEARARKGIGSSTSSNNNSLNQSELMKIFKRSEGNLNISRDSGSGGVGGALGGVIIDGRSMYFSKEPGSKLEFLNFSFCFSKKERVKRLGSIKPQESQINGEKVNALES
jgi:serine/threonine protein kinase